MLKSTMHSTITVIGLKLFVLFFLIGTSSSCMFFAKEQVLPSKNSIARIANSSIDTVWLKETETNLEPMFRLDTFILPNSSIQAQLLFGSNEANYDPIRYYLTEVYTSDSQVSIYKTGADTLYYELDLDSLDNSDKGFFRVNSWVLRDPDLCNNSGTCNISYTIEESDFQ